MRPLSFDVVGLNFILPHRAQFWQKPLLKKRFCVSMVVRQARSGAGQLGRRFTDCPLYMFTEKIVTNPHSSRATRKLLAPLNFPPPVHG